MINKTEHCSRQPRKDTQGKFDDDAFQLYKRRLCRFKPFIVRVLDRVLWGDSYLLSLRTKSYDVTIQMKALCLYLHMALFVSKFEKMKLGHLVEICFWLNLAVKGLNEVRLHITYLFLKQLVIVTDVFLLALLSHENLHSLPEVVWGVFSPESTHVVIQQSPLPR